MKFVVLKNTLQEGLAIVERISPRSSTLPILSHLLVAVKKTNVEFAATDLEVGVRYSALAQGEQEGSVVIPGKSLSQFAALLPEQKVILETKAGQLQVSCKGYKGLVKTIGSEEFPIIPTKNKEDLVLQIDTKTLTKALSQVASFTGQSQARPELSGVFVHAQNSELRFAATDSFRLAEKTLQLTTPIAQEVSCIVPAKTIRELVSIFSDRPGATNIFFSANQIVFEYANDQVHIEIVSRLIEGEYPRYQDIIPTKHQTSIVVAKEELLSHLKAASIFMGKTNDVRLVASPAQGTLGFSAKSVDVGEHESVLGVKAKGQETQASFNGRFLLDALPYMAGEEVELGLSGEDGPATIKPVQAEGYLYVVMPIRS